ncbi:GNAT family N-acetyltransferase [Bacillus massiliigorillae]|uniref:GNAT family N-acetyltransferase n=1 Tax=Bacillus massiliigorillae TaxID=1243664 RepID=UPI0003A3B0BD|nr:GNAT family N-acetyltransferase [Bacillus massiliigorillae]
MKTSLITNNQDLQLAFNIRKVVFVEEQNVPLEDEFDKFDNLNAHCSHVLVYYHDKAVGTGRLREVDGYGKLERICILPEFRKFGLGKEIIKKLEELAKANQLSKVKLHGQTQAEGFYRKLGYSTNGEVFMEDGIPHVLMLKEI